MDLLFFKREYGSTGGALSLKATLKVVSAEIAEFGNNFFPNPCEFLD
jgi:hypothetical protein